VCQTVMYECNINVEYSKLLILKLNIVNCSLKVSILHMNLSVDTDISVAMKVYK
jgi:hypothetical protein